MYAEYKLAREKVENDDDQAYDEYGKMHENRQDKFALGRQDRHFSLGGCWANARLRNHLGNSFCSNIPKGLRATMTHASASHEALDRAVGYCVALKGASLCCVGVGSS